MNFSGGSIVACNLTCNDSVKSIFEESTEDICSDFIKSIFENYLTQKSLFVDEKVVGESADVAQNLPSLETAVVTSSTEKSKKEGLEFSDAGCLCLETKNIFKDIKVPASSCFKIDWEENTSDLDKKADKKNAKNKKHTNDVTSLEEEKKERTFQKRRLQKPSLFQTEERFDDRLPYICFECKKTFAFYSFLLEHEKSHALNKVWYG